MLCCFCVVLLVLLCRVVDVVCLCLSYWRFVVACVIVVCIVVVSLLSSFYAYVSFCLCIMLCLLCLICLFVLLCYVVLSFALL